MFKKLCLLAGAALALSCSNAEADTFVPVGTYTFNGTVTVNAGLTLTGCLMTISVSTTGSDATVGSASLSGGLCGLIPFNNFTWNIDVTAPSTPWATATQLVLNGMAMKDANQNPCGPDNVLVNWTAGTPPKITFPAGTPVLPPVGRCSLGGTLTQSGGLPLTITK